MRHVFYIIFFHTILSGISIFSIFNIGIQYALNQMIVKHERKGGIDWRNNKQNCIFVRNAHK